MKYIFLFIYAGLTLLNLLKFQKIEQYMLEAGFSWTFSKVFPYITLLILGFLLARWCRRRIIFRVKYVRTIVFILVLALPFVVGLIMNPIYDGDFAQQGVEMTKKQYVGDFKNADLVVIAIPNCPYCYGSIQKLKLIKQRNPAVRIKFVVCNSDPQTLIPYKEAGGDAIKVVNGRNIDALSQIAEYRFPTFVLLKNNVPVSKWANDQFGVRALDKLEKALEEK